MAGGTTYWAVDSPRGASTAAIVGPGDQLWQQNFAVDGPGGPILWGPSVV